MRLRNVTPGGDSGIVGGVALSLSTEDLGVESAEGGTAAQFKLGTHNLGDPLTLPSAAWGSIVGKPTVMAAGADVVAARAALAPGTGVAEFDSFTGTDDQKWSAAHTWAKAQSPVAAIRFPARLVTLTEASNATPVYNGMKLLGPDGSNLAKDVETVNGVAQCTIQLNGVGSEATSLFVMPSSGKIYNVLVDGLAFKDISNSGAGGTSQFWYGPNTGAVLWTSEFRDLSFINMKSVLGSRAHSMACDQVRTTGHWQVLGFTDTPINLAGADNQYWDGGLLNLGSTATPPSGAYNIMLGELSNSKVGFIYNTVYNGWGGMLLQGGGDGGGWGVEISAGVIEGTEANPATKNLVNCSGGAWTFRGTKFDAVNSSGVNGAIVQSGGTLRLIDPTYQRLSTTSATWPFLYQTAGTSTVTNPICATAGEYCYATWANGLSDALRSGSTWTNGVRVGHTGSMPSVRCATVGGETFVISSGSVTQITGTTTIDGQSLAVGERLLIPNAPAASGTTSAFAVNTTQPANGVYKVSSTAGGNLTLVRAPEWSGDVNPTGLTVYVTSGGIQPSHGYGQTQWTVTNPNYAAAWSAWGTTALAFACSGGPNPQFSNVKVFGVFSASKGVAVRVGTVGSSATPTINTDNVDQFNVTALAADITSMTTNLAGTPADGQLLTVRFKDNGTARAITWGASFTGTLLSGTVAGQTCTQRLIYNSALAQWVGWSTIPVGPQGIGASWTPSNVYTSGQYYFCNSQTGASTATFSQSNVRVNAWVVTAPITISAVAAEFTVAGDAASVFRIGIWADDGTGKPSALVADCGSISTGTGNAGTVSTGGTPGVYAITGLSITLQPGLYWVGGACQSSGTFSSPTMRVSTAAGGGPQVPIPLGTSPIGSGGAEVGWQQSSVAGALGAFTPQASGVYGARIQFKVS